jgi:hypothetical protein
LKNNSKYFLLLMLATFCLQALFASVPPINGTAGMVSAITGTGRGLLRDVSGIGGNPAGLWTAGDEQFELGGLFRTQNGLFVNYLAPASEFSSVFLSALLSPAGISHRYYSAGIALNPNERSFLGVRAQLSHTPSALQMDISAGFLYKAKNNLYFGGDIQNLAQSITPDSTIRDYKRTYGLGLSFLPFLTPTWTLFFDVSQQNATWKGSNLSLGQQVSLGEIGNLKLWTTLHKEALGLPESSWRASGGVRLQQRLQQSLLYLQYGYQGHTLQAPPLASAQIFAVGAEINTFRDRTPPRIKANIDKGLLLSHFQSGQNDYIHFQLFAEDAHSPIHTWHLVIYQANQELEPTEAVLSFSGKGPPPRNIRWDGRNHARELVDAGFYTFRFFVSDAKGNLSYTLWQAFEIR